MADESSNRIVRAAHGRTLHLGRVEPHDTLEVRSPTGEVELAIQLTAEGPKLRLRALDLEIEAARSIRLKCETFELEAEHDARISSSRGAIALLANDDVDVKGERILLNADTPAMPKTWEEFQSRAGLGAEPPMTALTTTVEAADGER